MAKPERLDEGEMVCSASIRDDSPTRDGSKSGITFHRPVTFWVGTAAVVAGTIMHLPDYFRAADMHYRLAGVPMSSLMPVGMVLVMAGFGLAAYSLFPSRATSSGLRPAVAQGDGFHVRAMDGAPLTAAHWRLISVLGIALVIDVMKPATLGFVLPGAKVEYGLTTAQVTMLPMFALIGTVVGSALWGLLADRLGRRAAILLASLMFIGTAICGAMRAFGWNLLMCFLMGASAGGMLPIVFVLLAETIPAKKRGWLAVLIGGLGTVGGYLAASAAAALLEPRFGWRILWLLGLPTGALVIVLNRFIPESPRFLLMRGRIHEARRVMESFGGIVEREEPAAAAASHHVKDHPNGMTQLFQGPYRAQTIGLGVLGVSWGLVNWGFLTWLPTILREMEFNGDVANGILARSALIAIPGTLVVAWLYGHWSSKKTMVLFAAATSAVLVTFATLSPSAARSSGVLTLLVVSLLVSSTGVIATLSPYSSEVYPTQFRGIGTGFAAASSKFGGICGPPLLAAVLTAWPGLTAPALIVAGPIAIAALVLGLKGIETRGRRLEDVQLKLSRGGRH